MVWKMDAELTLVAGSGAGVSLPPINTLCLTYRGQELRIGIDKTAARLGRDADNDLVGSPRPHHAGTRAYTCTRVTSC